MSMTLCGLRWTVRCQMPKDCQALTCADTLELAEAALT